VKAGALKVGDQVSTRDSIPHASGAGRPGPRLAANDNQPLTVTEIIRDSRAARVYNFEVESRSGEITHNYFVGDDAAWVHNGKFSARKARKIWEAFFKKDWPVDDSGNPLQVHHENPVCERPDLRYDPQNIKPMFQFGHRLLHSLRGDFRSWGGLR
jgi:hypothetical protein